MANNTFPIAGQVSKIHSAASTTEKLATQAADARGRREDKRRILTNRLAEQGLVLNKKAIKSRA